MGDAASLANAVLDLLEHKEKMNEMRRKAYEHARGKVWPIVAREYVDVFQDVSRQAADRTAASRGTVIRNVRRAAAPARSRRGGHPAA